MENTKEIDNILIEIYGENWRKWQNLENEKIEDIYYTNACLYD